MIELLVTLAIVGIVTTIGIPSFTQTITSNRLTSSANDLVTSLNIARSEAIKRGVQVTVERKLAVANQWDDGWNVFVDQDSSGAFNDDGDTNLCETTAGGLPSEDCILRTYDSLNPGYTLRTAATNAITYAPTGILNTGADTFRLCDSTADTTISRSIIINLTGRARVATGTTGCP